MLRLGDLQKNYSFNESPEFIKIILLLLLIFKLKMLPALKWILIFLCIRLDRYMYLKYIFSVSLLSYNETRSFYFFPAPLPSIFSLHVPIQI